MEIQNLLESSNNSYKSMAADQEKLATKWAASGLLEGLEDKHAGNMALILENQAKQIVSEANSTGTGGTFTAGQGEQWAGVALPLVRKVFAQISAQDFVSVQPMSLPSGLVFYLDFKYGDGRNGRADGDNLYGNVTEASTKMAKDTDPSGGLYGAGQFGYTINSSSKAFAGTATGSATSASIAYNDDLTITDYETVTVTFAGSDAIDAKGARAFRLISASTDITSNPELTTVAGNAVTFVVTGSNVTAASIDATVLYHKQPVDNDRGDYEANSDRAVDTSIVIPEIDVTLASEAIVAKTRKLKAQWTPEFAQDLNAYHSIDAEAELTSMLSEYISQEIDFEILDMLISGAKSTGYWSAQVGREWNGNAFADYSTTGAAASAFNQGAWFQTLGTVVAGVSNKIHQKTLRGGANFMVVSPDVATIIESIPGYASSADNGDAQFAFGVTKIGSLNSRFQVYKNPYMKENVILMGYRGTQFLETGAVYSPYIPLIMTPLVYDPKNFTPRKGVMTRYAKKMLRGEFYGKVYVDGLHKIQ